MAMPERSIVVGVFTERGAADRAIEELQNAGFRGDQIKLEQQDAASGPIATPSGLPGGSVTAAGTPGPIITQDDSTTHGGLIGKIKRLFGGRTDERIVDDLVAMGVPEEEARYYQGEFELGRTIVTVEAGDRRADALVILRSNGAYDVTTPRGTQAPTAQAGTYDPNAQAGTTTPSVPQGTYDPNAQAGSDNPNVSRETYDPNAQAGTTTPNVPQGTYDPNAPQGTDDAMVGAETYDTQPRQTGIWDDRNA